MAKTLKLTKAEVPAVMGKILSLIKEKDVLNIANSSLMITVTPTSTLSQFGVRHDCLKTTYTLVARTIKHVCISELSLKSIAQL